MTATDMSGIETVITLLVGGTILLFGRRLFWILGGLAFVVVAVFLVAYVIDPSTVEFTPKGAFHMSLAINVEDPNVLQLMGLAALIAFIAGVVITLRFPVVASALVGFLGGVGILYLTLFLFNVTMVEWVRRSLLIIAGVLVAIVGIRNPAQTMILLSTVAGANIIFSAFNLDENTAFSAIIWFVSMLIGIVYQSNAWRIQERRASSALTTTVEVETLQT